MSYEHIWAPWRLEYVQGSQEDEEPVASELLDGGDPKCFLCAYAASGNDARNRVVHRAGRCLTVLNRYPYNNGHLLVAPLLHRARLDELTPEEHADLAREVTQMVGLLEAAMHPEGFNVGLNLGRVAGAGLPGHLHWHIVPRWNGDTNFMAVMTAVRVIPQSLEALWEALTDELAKQKSS